MSSLKHIGVLLAVMFGLNACAQPAPLNFSVPNVGFSQEKIDADMRSLTVTVARPEEQIDGVDVLETERTFGGTGSALTSTWKEALTEALNRMAIFKDSAERKVNLSVKIIKLKAPNFSIKFKTHTIAKYEIIDRANGSIIYSENISSVGETPANHAFVGSVRHRESINRSIQNNIAAFLQKLQFVDAARPMFPSSQTSDESGGN